MITYAIHPNSIHFWKGTRPVGGRHCLIVWSLVISSIEFPSPPSVNPLHSRHVNARHIVTSGAVAEVIDQGCWTGQMLNTFQWLALILNLKLLRNIELLDSWTTQQKWQRSLRGNPGRRHVVIQHSEWSSMIILDPVVISCRNTDTHKSALWQSLGFGDIMIYNDIQWYIMIYNDIYAHHETPSFDPSLHHQVAHQLCSFYCQMGTSRAQLKNDFFPWPERWLKIFQPLDFAHDLKVPWFDALNSHPNRGSFLTFLPHHP